MPFLGLSVAIFSFLVFAAALTSVLFIYGLLSLIPRSLAPQIEGSSRAPFVFMIILPLIVILDAVAYIFINHSALIYGRFQYAPLKDEEMASLLGWVAGGNIFILGLLLRLFPEYLNRILSVVYGSITLLLIGSLFAHGVYDTFLRLTRFGGGIETVVLTKDAGSLKGYLFLVTEKRVVLYMDTANRFMEIPSDDVQSFEYDQSPNWKLPPTALREQAKYLK